METIYAKSILTTRKEPARWFDVKYNMNLYRGCTFGCLYCNSRSDCYQVAHFDEVAYKGNALELLEKELKAKRQTGVVGMGAMSDPYNPHEVGLQLTRRALELILKHGFGLHLSTKSDLILRDLDLIASIARRAPVSVGLTITSLDDCLAAKIEPGAPSSSRRFEAIKELAAKGVLSGVMMMPILPFITDTPDNVVGLVERSAACGAGYAYPWMGVTMRAGQREYLYRGFERYFPGCGLKTRYIKAFGDTYECLSPDHALLTEKFKEACKKTGLVYRMSDIICRASKSIEKTQISLFDGL